MNIMRIRTAAGKALRYPKQNYFFSIFITCHNIFALKRQVTYFDSDHSQFYAFLCIYAFISMCQHQHADASRAIEVIVFRSTEAFSTSFPITNTMTIPQHMLLFSYFTYSMRKRDASFLLASSLEIVLALVMTRAEKVHIYSLIDI